MSETLTPFLIGLAIVVIVAVVIFTIGLVFSFLRALYRGEI